MYDNSKSSLKDDMVRMCQIDDLVINVILVDFAVALTTLFLTITSNSGRRTGPVHSMAKELFNINGFTLFKLLVCHWISFRILVGVLLDFVSDGTYHSIELLNDFRSAFPLSLSTKAFAFCHWGLKSLLPCFTSQALECRTVLQSGTYCRLLISIELEGGRLFGNVLLYYLHEKCSVPSLFFKHFAKYRCCNCNLMISSFTHAQHFGRTDESTRRNGDIR